MPCYIDKICGLARGKKGLPFLLGMMVCLMGALGCDNQEKRMVDPKGTLEGLAATYWNKRLIDKDYQATYEMEQDKGSLSFEEYKARIYNAGGIKYVSLKVKEVQVDKDKGHVTMTVNWELAPFTKPFEAPLLDEWIIDANQWKHVLPKERTKLPEMMSKKP